MLIKVHKYEPIKKSFFGIFKGTDFVYFLTLKLTLNLFIFINSKLLFVCTDFNYFQNVKVTELDRALKTSKVDLRMT